MESDFINQFCEAVRQLSYQYDVHGGGFEHAVWALGDVLKIAADKIPDGNSRHLQLAQAIRQAGNILQGVI